MRLVDETEHLAEITSALRLPRSAGSRTSAARIGRMPHAGPSGRMPSERPDALASSLQAVRALREVLVRTIVSMERGRRAQRGLPGHQATRS